MTDQQFVIVFAVLIHLGPFASTFSSNTSSSNYSSSSNSSMVKQY
uniref:Uncharacterized protein n=1 Tax=Anguilla anguilla TaxID=7936 RepID=A0A0E9QG34_ANGAN